MAYNTFNPYSFNNGYNLQAMQNQIAQLQQMQNQIQSPIQNNQPLPNGVVQMGTWVMVKTIQDMENYPAPINGEPVNIFIDGQGVFYSKKMMNGGTNCQPFSFSALNNTGKEAEKPSEDAITIPEWANMLIDKVNALEGKINAKKTNPKKAVEENGI